MNDPETTNRFLVGPFPKENFDSLKWKVVRQKIYELNSTNEEEIMPYCKEFLQLLTELNSCPDYDAYFGSPATKQFFFQEIFGTNAKNLIATRTFNNSTLLDISNAILMNMITFWVKAFKEDNAHLVEMAKNILDPQKYYYKANNQEIFSSSGISSFAREPSKEHLDWIATLKNGDLIDCVKEESACHRLCWLPARVSYDMENYIKISFLHDFDRSSRYLNRVSNATEIARPGTRCKDLEWRLNLQKGDELDACSSSSTWYNAVILDTRESETNENDVPVKEVYVGFRRYDEEGDREDEEGRSYFGVSKRNDDWFVVTDPRIAKKGTMVKRTPSKDSEETMVDDSNDHIYTAGGEKIFALTRQMHCRSTFMVEMINKFGELGGFDLIMNRIKNTENWAPIEVVTLLVSVVGNISMLLHKDFADEYIPSLKNAVWNNIVKSPESNIRNFTKERLDEIIEACETLFKRIFSINERREFLESLNFQVCTICFDSHFLERKIQGLKTLLEMIKCLRLGTLRYTTNDIMNNYIRKNQIFEKIYGSRGHSQLIQRSVEFLKYVASEEVLQIPELESVWSETTKGDTETKLVIYKLFSDASLYFKENHLDFLILKISEIEPSIMIPDEIELVYELSRFSSKPAGFIDKARALFWKIISETENPYPVEIRELALTKFCSIMRSWDLREERLNVLYDCIENIKNEKSVIASLKILQKVIDNYPSNSATIEKFTKSTCIKHLIKEKDLQGVLLNDLRRFKENTRKRLPQQGVITEEILDNLVGERAKYLVHITERLQFINFISSHSGNKDGGLSYDLLSKLWDVVVHQSLIPSEKNAIYKWIQETAESKSGFPMSMDDLIRFFKEKMVSKEDYETITAEGFDCFKSVFLLVNEKLGNLTKVNIQSNSSPSRYSGIGPHNYDYYNNHDNDSAKTKEKEFEFSVNKSPEELEGIQSVWDLTLTSKSEEVAERARNSLNDLYLNVTNELHEEMVNMRVQYLNKCLYSLQETLAQRSVQLDVDFSVFSSRVVRCLSLITKILDESEKKGVGSLKSHSGLIKGEMLSFSVANEVTWGSDVPRKIDIRLHSNTTIYELRVKISQHFKVTWDQIKLSRAQQKEIKDNENGKTIGDLRIRNGEELTANKRPTKAIPQVDLVDSNGNLNPVAKRIFVEWYNTHSENGKMSPDNCAAFINSCTNDGCRGDDRRVKDVFSNYDTDRDGFLTIEDFLDFYSTSSRQRPQVVWSNLHSHHYRNDLRKASEVEEEKVDITVLPRYILSSNVDYFQLLFSLLDFGGRVAVETWKLLNRLPTSSQIFSEIVKLKGIRESDSAQKDWTQVLDPTSNYKLLYALEVMEYLMEDEGDNEESSAEGVETGESLLWAKDPQLSEFRKTWQADFIYYGGFDYLFKIFNTYAAKDHKALGTFDKNILSFILKILSNYLAAAFANKVTNIYSCLSFIRLFHLDLNFIQNYLEKKNNPESSQAAVENIPSSDANQAINEEKEDLKIEETPEFKTLVEKLQGELGSHILSTINLKEMIKVISELGYDVLVQGGELESEDRMILEYSINILTSIFLYDNQTINYFLTLGNEGSRSSDKFVLEGIFCSRSFNIRNYFSHALYILSKNTKEHEKSLLARHYIKLFLNNLPSSKDSSKEDCNQYFELLCKFLEETYSGANKLTDDSLNFEELMSMLVQRIKEHSSSEDRRNLLLVDKAFTGLLQLCERILEVKPELKSVVGAVESSNLIEELFNTCLFDTRDPDASFGDLDNGKDSKSVQEPVKCKSKESRQIAYKLLLTLCRGSQSNLMILLRCLEGLMKSIMRLNAAQDWNYSPSSDVKSLYGYVGIRNPRCICYMNAMLQQFFMTPTFRYGLLAADDKKPINLVKNSEGFEIDDNVLHQLQQMFGFLELSDRQDYDSHEFCFSFKDYSGQPVNISIQQDTQEFLNMIFDKLENGLKETPFKNILQGVYGGKTTNQTICHGCGTVREREDIFYNLSVEVKNMKTIYDSFEKFITGEIIEDYNCESCKKKNSITKRTCLSSLPNVLIVHLQRIVFDLDTLMNQKINSRLEFPFELNLEPYTKEALAKKDKQKNKNKTSKKANEEGEDEFSVKDHEDDRVKPTRNISESIEEEAEKIDQAKVDQLKEEADVEHEKEYYEYKLVGVLVHDGTAEFGHYYSYINTNRGDIRGEKGSSEKDKWLEFNDSTIRSFNTKSIENECFGGEGTESNDDWGWSKFGRENSKNAYILVYERVLKDPLKLTVTSQEEEAYLRRVLNVDKLEKEDPKAVQVVREEVDGKALTTYECDFFALKGFVPSSIYKKVWEGNHKFMFEQHIYNDDFFNFIKEVCNSLSLPPSQQGAYSVIHPMHNTLDPETKQNVQNLIQILSHLIFHLLAKSQESDVIVSLSFVLKNLASLVPEAAFSFFEALAINETKYITQLFLNCPSRLVRHYTSQAILQSINILIAYHNLSLDLRDLYQRKHQVSQMNDSERYVFKIESEIVNFLDHLIASIPTEAAKNWTKIGQFFEFWKEFANSGESQMHYLYQKEFIAVLIDFYLDKRSPLVGFSEKKHTIGNRYTEPELNALVQTVSLMIRRAKVNTKSGAIPYTSGGLNGLPTYDLSENDEKCILCSEYYEKAVKDKYDFYAVGVTIQHFAFENENFSWMISHLIIYGLSKTTSDDARPYLEAMSYLISLNDYLQPRRLEWIIGFPQPLFQSGRFGSDSFGLYGNYSLDEVVVNYETPLSANGCTSLINVIMQNRKRMESMSMICLKQLLILADINDTIFKFFISLPPPSYLYAKFSDWVPAFIEYFLADCKRYYTSYSKEELGLEGQKYWNNLEKKINERLEVHEKELQSALAEHDAGVEKENNGAVLKGFFPNYIIGRTFKSEEIDKIPYEQSQESYEVSLRTQEIYCYITDSKPTGTSNLAFPRSVVDDASLKSYEVKANSPLALFIQPRGVQSSLDSNKSIQNVLQNEVEAILAQASESTQSNTSGSPNPQQRNLDISTDAEGGQSESSPPKGKGAKSSPEVVEIQKSVPLDEDFDFEYEVNPVIRRFYLKNDSPFSLHCQLGIFPKSKSFLNFRIPTSVINVNVRPHSSTCILTITKIFPQLGWGDYEVKYYIQGLENQDYGSYQDSQKYTTGTTTRAKQNYSSDFVEDRYNDLLN